MQENIKISIVSPVYLAEEILNKLVDSIFLNIKSITDNFEVILVDDGSSDGSWDKIMQSKKILAP